MTEVTTLEQPVEQKNGFDVPLSAVHYTDVPTPPSVGRLAAALAQAQSRFGIAELDRVNPHFDSKYASLASIHRAIQPHLGEAGIAVVQMPEIQGRDVYLHTKLIHSSGEMLESSLFAPMPERKGNPVQLMAGVLSYLKRYALSAMLGVATGEDDDGNSAGDRSYRNDPPSDHPATQKRDRHPTTQEMPAATQAKQSGQAPRVKPPGGQHSAPPVERFDPENARRKWHAVCNEKGIAPTLQRQLLGVESRTHADPRLMDKLATELQTTEGEKAFEKLRHANKLDLLRECYEALPEGRRTLFSKYKDARKGELSGKAA